MDPKQALSDLTGKDELTSPATDQQTEQTEQIGADTAKSKNETAPETRFFHYFQQELTALIDQIDKLETKPQLGGERNDAIDHCLAGISRLSKEVKEASSYVPSYHQKIYADAIKALQDKLAATRERLAPRPKFSFKNIKKRPSAMSVEDLQELHEQHAQGLANKAGAKATGEGAADGHDTSKQETVQADPNPPPVPNDSGAAPVVLNETHDAFLLSPSSGASSTTSVPAYITDIDKCVVDLSIATERAAELPPWASLSVQSIRNTLMICGRVTGPVHVTGAENCTIVVGCQQLRLHQCTNSNVYLSCGSQPIIEDCKGLKFARLPDVYKNRFAMPSSHDLWDQVQDFDWIKTEPSPNWSILDDSKKLPQHFWEYLTSKDAKDHLEEIKQYMMDPKK